MGGSAEVAWASRPTWTTLRVATVGKVPMPLHGHSADQQNRATPNRAKSESRGRDSAPNVGRSFGSSAKAEDCLVTFRTFFAPKPGEGATLGAASHSLSA